MANFYRDCGLAWYDACFGSMRPQVQILPIPLFIIIEQFLRNYSLMILPDDEEELESRIDELAHNTDAWHY